LILIFGGGYYGYSMVLPVASNRWYQRPLDLLD
jgi:hypothetical protein